MRQKIHTIFYSSAIFIAVCLLVALVIKPFSLLNFVGPIAGITTAIILVWGFISLISVFISTLILILMLKLYSDIDLDLAVVFLIYLAAFLQAFWAKQLTHNEISNQQWISSRSSLIEFMLKIGPIIGIIAASCGVVVAILDNGTFNTSLEYSFFRAWSTSVLVSVFAIPSLLFINGEQKLSVSKRTFVIISSILGCIAIGLLFQISQQQQEHKRLDVYEKSISELDNAVVREISNINAKISAMSAFFNSSKEIDFNEFIHYSNEVYQDQTSIELIQWSPIVEVKEKQAFEAYANKQLGIHYKITSADAKNSPYQNDFTPFIPVFYIFPEKYNHSFYGFDLFAYKAITPVIIASLNLQQIRASIPFSLNQQNELNPRVMIINPINNHHSLNHFGQMKSQSGNIAVGFISILINLDQLVNNLLADVSDNNITMTIADITAGDSYLIYGNKLHTKNRLANTTTIDFFGRKWQLNIVENATWLSQGNSWQTWVMLFGGVVGGFIFQLLLLIMAAYSIELSHKISEKTRELIRANELSEKENLSKAHFLQMLTLELSEPIKLAERLTQNSTSEFGSNKLKQFNKVTKQLTHILMSMSDLSTIESRNNKIDKETFDFSYFLSQIEKQYEQKSIGARTKIKFLFDCELPNFVITDKKRLEKLLLALQDNVLRLFLDSDVQVSVKTHYHKDFATLFFTCSALSPKENMPISSWLEKDIANFSTSMALATELVHVLKGNIKLTLVPTGDVVMTVSLPISINDQPSTSNKIDDVNIVPHSQKTRVLLIEEPLSTNFETTPLLLGLDYQVEIVDDPSELPYAIDSLQVDIIIIDNITSMPYVKGLEELFSRFSDGEGPKVIGIYRGIEYRQLKPAFKRQLSECLLYPISSDSLQIVLNKVQKK
ncbi:CHASE domain-containing protein [Thalassotalea piscium]